MTIIELSEYSVAKFISEIKWQKKSTKKYFFNFTAMFLMKELPKQFELSSNFGV